MSYKFSINCLKFSSILLFLLLFQFAGAQKNSKEYGIANYPVLDEMLMRYQKLLGNDVVTMVWTDTLVFKKEMGDFNSRTAAPIASASKLLTTAVVLQMVDEGKISLDDKVSQYLPVFEKYGKNYITLRHCLSHYTGIEADGGKKIFDRKKFASLEEEVNAFAAKEIQTNPGTEFWYSNIGLNIAARVLEVVSKKKFEMLAQQKLFRPLGMRYTTFANLDASAPNPSGGAKSSAEDYMKFLVMLLNKGKNTKGVQVLYEASVLELMKVQARPEQMKYAPKAAHGMSYTLGAWAIEVEDGKATSITSPGLFGTWPVVDFKRGYALLFFPKTLLSEQKADAYLEMVHAVEERVK